MDLKKRLLVNLICGFKCACAGSRVGDMTTHFKAHNDDRIFFILISAPSLFQGLRTIQKVVVEKKITLISIRYQILTIILIILNHLDLL